ncbi:MAG: TolC family protein [bacterium]|nr:TolC family protein [bacterium]
MVARVMNTRTACLVAAVQVLAGFVCAGSDITVYDAETIEAREQQLLESTVSNLPDVRAEVVRAVSYPALAPAWQPLDSNVYITLRECILWALERNLGLTISRYEPGIGWEKVRQQRSVFDPMFSMEFTWSGAKAPRVFKKTAPRGFSKTVVGNTRSDTIDWHGGIGGRFITGLEYGYRMGQSHTRVDEFGGLFNPSYRTYQEAYLTVPLLKNFGIDVNLAPVRIARNDWRISRVELDAAVQDLILEVTAAYWSLYYHREEAAAQEYTLQLAKELLKVNEAKVKVGMAAPLDVTQAKARIAAQEEQLLIARNAVRNAEDKLRALINFEMNELFLPRAMRRIQYHLVPLEKPVIVDMTHDEPTLIEQALQNQQVIAVAKLRMQNAREQLKVAKNQLLPEVNMIGSLGFEGVGDDYGHAYGDQWRGEHPRWSLGVEVSLPLFYNEPIAAYRQAKYASRQAELTIEQVRHTVAINVRTALRNVETNRKRIDATREAARFAREQLAAEQEKFKVGQSTTFDVLYYQDQLATALKNEIKALTDWRISLTQLYRTIGRAAAEYQIQIDEYLSVPASVTPRVVDAIWR